MAGAVTTEHSLGSTAYWTAAVRAMEHEREDRLFSDPWARDLAGEVGGAWIAGKSPESVIPIVLRTRFFDDFLQRVASEDAIRQIVLVAAGLDTRAYRLGWPAGTQVFELDQPAVLRHKEDVLTAAGAQPACARRSIGKDLTEPWADALIEAGFEPEQPSGWLLEGFLFYLPNEAITHLLDEVSRLAAPGSRLGFDINNSITLTHPLTRPWVEMQAAAGAPWLGSLDDPAAFLAARGWAAELSQAGQPDANHGRWPYPVIPTSMPDMPHNWFVTAEKMPPA
jgi:methyltransferase (TIGR00027 family)